MCYRLQMMADSRPRAKEVSVADYFHQWLKLKFGSDRLVVEMAYNIVDGLRRYEVTTPPPSRC